MSLADQCLALAACMQAAQLVDRLATGKEFDPSLLAMAVDSTLNTDPVSVSELFQGAASVRDGLLSLRTLLNKEQQSLSQHSLRYFVSLLHLSSKLKKSPQVLAQLGEALQKAQRQQDYFDQSLHSSLIAGLAQSYQSCISPLGHRIHVIGDPKLLQQQASADKIRMLLLFGIRSAFLWRQLGGSQWQLFWQRKKMAQTCQQWLING